MKYSDYSVRDFIQDEYFQNWVFHTDDGINSFWESWLKSHPDKILEVEQARKLLKSIHFEKHVLPADAVADIWNKFQESKYATADDAVDNSRMKWKYAGIAAAVIFALTSGFYFYNSGKPWHEYHTAFGQTSTIRLPDGSSVVLNANSTLTLYADWQQTDTREIWINGEGYFDVVHTSDNQTFTVHTTEGVTVEVLGTTFNVYNRTNSTKVTLNSGQIRLNLPLAKASEMVVMKPGEMVEYKEKKYRKREVNPLLYSAWTNNKIILDHTSLAEMVNMLKESYGLDVKISDPELYSQTVSGSMPLGNADILLKQMAKAFQLRIHKEGNVIVMDEIIAK